MKTIVRIVALFVLLSVFSFRQVQRPLPNQRVMTLSPPLTKSQQTRPQMLRHRRLRRSRHHQTDEDTSTPDDGEFSPATIGEEPGGDFHEEIDGTIRLTSDLNSGDGYASLDLPVPAGATIAGLTDLGVDFILEADDDCGGGSPRFSIGVDMDNDGSADFYLYVTFDPCVAGGANSTGNLVESDAPHTFGPAGGPLTWAEVVANYGTGKITYLGLIVDGGGGQPDGEQTIFVQSLTGVASAFEGVSNLQVIKTQDTTEGPVVPGACFTIFAYGEGGIRGDVLAAEQCDDDLDGRVDFLGLPALTALIIAETVAPDGYAAGPDFPVTLAEGDNFIGFPNSLLPPTSNLRVIKTKDTTEGPVVPGACFTIFAYGEGGTRGDIVADQQCDDDLDGNVDFVGLPALTALIVAETVAPEGYAPGADFPITLAEGDNAIGFPNSLLPDSTATPTATATTPAEVSPTATSPGPAEPTSTTSTNPPSTGSTSVTTLPSTGTGTNSSSSLSLGLIAALLTLVVISGGYLITKRRNA